MLTTIGLIHKQRLFLIKGRDDHHLKILMDVWFSLGDYHVQVTLVCLVITRYGGGRVWFFFFFESASEPEVEATVYNRFIVRNKRPILGLFLFYFNFSTVPIVSTIMYLNSVVYIHTYLLFYIPEIGTIIVCLNT